WRLDELPGAVLAVQVIAHTDPDAATDRRHAVRLELRREPPRRGAQAIARRQAVELRRREGEDDPEDHDDDDELGERESTAAPSPVPRRTRRAGEVLRASGQRDPGHRFLSGPALPGATCGEPLSPDGGAISTAPGSPIPGTDPRPRPHRLPSR